MNKHHFLFPERQWESQPAQREMRQMRQSTAYMDKHAHVELHRDISCVPLLSHHVAMCALGRLRDNEPTSNPIERIEHLQRAIEQSANVPRADRIERELAELAVYSLELQKPYLLTDVPMAEVIDLRRAA